MKTIIRNSYLKIIKSYVGKHIIKVLTGQRRVGKTTLLKQLVDLIKSEDSKANIIYVNKEFHEFKDIKNSEDLYSYIIQKVDKNKNNYIFVDEVQEVKNFEIALRQLLVEEYDIYCTGSNAKMLSGDLATYLSGRYIEFQIYDLNYKEFLQFHNLGDSNETLIKYIRYGGLPYLINLELQDEIVYGYLRSIYNTILLKDIVSRYNIRDVEFLNRLIEYLSDNLGSYVSSKKISNFLKSRNISMSNNTVLNYLKYLSNSFFINKVGRYDIIGKKRFEINDKYYFSDLGLIHSIIPYRDDDIEKVFENMVYNQLVHDGYQVSAGKLKDKEIDFIATRNSEIKYIQVAYLLPDKHVRDREFGNLMEIHDNYEKIVISADEFTSDYKGVKNINIRKFLNQ